MLKQYCNLTPIAILFSDIKEFYKPCIVQNNITNVIINKIKSNEIPKEWYSSPDWFKVALSLKATKSSSNLDSNKQAIITRFYTHVKGEKPYTEDQNIKHCGKEGHWLENRMGITHNALNQPDIYNYEMKKSSNGKTTLGDFSANEYAFSKKRTFINTYNNWTNLNVITRKNFLCYFGSPNPLKNNRYSWSGKCFPTYNSWNVFGQILNINENNDICIYYFYENDKRKNIFFPDFLKTEKPILIAIWKADTLKIRIENKFNKKGFFICKKSNDIYNNLCFGNSFTFEHFISCMKNKKIRLDSGMYDGNKRNYSQFRGLVTSFWEELITECY